MCGCGQRRNPGQTSAQLGEQVTVTPAETPQSTDTVANQQIAKSAITNSRS